MAFTRIQVEREPDWTLNLLNKITIMVEVRTCLNASGIILIVASIIDYCAKIELLPPFFIFFRQLQTHQNSIHLNFINLS